MTGSILQDNQIPSLLAEPKEHGITVDVLLGVGRWGGATTENWSQLFQERYTGPPVLLNRNGLGEVMCNFFPSPFTSILPAVPLPMGTRPNIQFSKHLPNSPCHPHTRFINSKFAAFSYGTVMLFIPLQLQTLRVSRNSSYFVLRVAQVYTEERHPVHT